MGTASAGKHDALRSFGVEHAIDYRTADVEAEVKRLTKGRGVDVVLDPIGGPSFGASYRMLAPVGRLVMLGISSMSSEKRNAWRVLRSWWAMQSFDPLSLINRNRGVFGLNVGHLWDERRLLQPLMDLILTELSAGRLEPIVARTFPLERVADAHRFIQSRSNIGKVVLTT
ncbi:MAG TPA: zinc-binding dehydrogenase [Vicinamibacterales bacterium]